MTKRDFFILIIKLFGLFSIVTSLFSVLPSNISFVFMDIDVISLIWLIITIVVMIGLFVFLLFKSDKVVNLLRLDKGFDDDRIELGNLTPSSIVKLAIIIIGGLLIIENIPGFLSHTLFAFKVDIMGMTYKTMDKFYWTVSGINLVLGFLFLTNYNSVSKLLRTKDSEK